MGGDGIALPWYGFAFVVGTNIAFLPALLRALQLEHQHLRAFLALHIILWSSLFHLCWPANGYCLLDPYVHRGYDYSGALLLPFSLLLLLAPFGPIAGQTAPGATERQRRGRPSRVYVEVWLHLAALWAILSTSSTGEHPITWAIYLPTLGVGLLVLLLSWWTVYRRYGYTPTYDRVDLAIALALGTVGLVFFLWVEDYVVPPEYGWVIHSLWHVFAGIAFFYLLEARSRIHTGLQQFHPWPMRDPTTNTEGEKDRNPYLLRGQSLHTYVSLEVPQAS